MEGPYQAICCIARPDPDSVTPFSFDLPGVEDGAAYYSGMTTSPVGALGARGSSPGDFS